MPKRADKCTWWPPVLAVRSWCDEAWAFRQTRATTRPDTETNETAQQQRRRNGAQRRRAAAQGRGRAAGTRCAAAGAAAGAAAALGAAAVRAAAASAADAAVKPIGHCCLYFPTLTPLFCKLQVWLFEQVHLASPSWMPVDA
jgi:hypothetical protein